MKKSLIHFLVQTTIDIFYILAISETEPSSRITLVITYSELIMNISIFMVKGGSIQILKNYFLVLRTFENFFQLEKKNFRRFLVLHHIPNRFARTLLGARTMIFKVPFSRVGWRSPNCALSCLTIPRSLGEELHTWAERERQPYLRLWLRFGARSVRFNSITVSVVSRTHRDRERKRDESYTWRGTRWDNHRTHWSTENRSGPYAPVPRPHHLFLYPLFYHHPVFSTWLLRDPTSE